MAKPKIYFLAKLGMSGYANPTEPNLYPDAFQSLVRLEDYERDTQDLAKKFVDMQSVVGCLEIKLKTTEEKLARASWVPGHFQCKKCSFYLVANIISMQHLDTFANTEPQACENGCGPMWRVTWREHSDKFDKNQEAMVDRLLIAQDTIETLRAELKESRELYEANHG